MPMTLVKLGKRERKRKRKSKQERTRNEELSKSIKFLPPENLNASPKYCKETAGREKIDSISWSKKCHSGIHCVGEISSALARDRSAPGN